MRGDTWLSAFVLLGSLASWAEAVGAPAQEYRGMRRMQRCIRRARTALGLHTC